MSNKNLMVSCPCDGNAQECAVVLNWMDTQKWTPGTRNTCSITLPDESEYTFAYEIAPLNPLIDDIEEYSKKLTDILQENIFRIIAHHKALKEDSE